jgi:hypothetical protein
MKIDTNITISDYRAFRKHLLLRYYKIHLLAGLTIALFALLAWSGGNPDEPISHKILVFIGLCLLFSGVMGAYFLFLWVLRLAGIRKFHPQLGPHQFEITGDGVIESNEFSRMETKVNSIKGIDETSKYYFIVTKFGFGHIIPRRDVVDAEKILSLKSAVSRNG